MALVSQFQRFTWGSDPVTGGVVNPDFAAIARAYGYTAETIETESLLEAAVQRCLAANGPSLLHCKIHEGDDVIPMLLGGQALDGMYPFAK
jgi:acetolactate synthase-1/2/3 large subunit